MVKGAITSDCAHAVIGTAANNPNVNRPAILIFFILFMLFGSFSCLWFGWFSAQHLGRAETDGTVLLAQPIKVSSAARSGDSHRDFGVVRGPSLRNGQPNGGR